MLKVSIFVYFDLILSESFQFW